MTSHARSTATYAKLRPRPQFRPRANYAYSFSRWYGAKYGAPLTPAQHHVVNAIERQRQTLGRVRIYVDDRGHYDDEVFDILVLYLRWHNERMTRYTDTLVIHPYAKDARLMARHIPGAVGFSGRTPDYVRGMTVCSALLLDADGYCCGRGAMKRPYGYYRTFSAVTPTVAPGGLVIIHGCGQPGRRETSTTGFARECLRHRSDPSTPYGVVSATPEAIERARSETMVELHPPQSPPPELWTSAICENGRQGSPPGSSAAGPPSPIVRQIPHPIKTLSRAG